MTNNEQRSSVIEAALADFVAAAKEALGDSVRAIVLYGSAAEGALRARSDVNMVLVLRRFDAPRIDRLRDPLRAAQVAMGLDAMLLLESEIPAAAEAFAMKFDDIAHRRRVLHGDDPFAALAIAPEALARRLQQVLLNLVLRLRHAYATRAAREEQLPDLLADASGPLRVSAATLLELRGTPAPSPKAALTKVVEEWGLSGGGAALAQLSAVREGARLAPGEGGALLLTLIAMAQRMREELGS